MNRWRVGFVTCVHPLYEVASVVSRREETLCELRKAGCDVVVPEIPHSPSDAVEIAASLRKSEVDLVVLFFCTWVSEEVTLALARELSDVPMLLWALPYLDRDIPMPSPISGITATASNFRRAGKPFASLVGEVSPVNVEQVAAAARAAAVASAVRRARFGVIGSPCPGMMDVVVDETCLQRTLGATALHLDLEGLLHAAEAAPKDEVADAIQRITAVAPGPATGDFAENLRLYAGLKHLVRQHGLSAYCVRCWPELRDQRRITPCTAHALLASEGVPSTCEVDLPALITTYMLNRLAGTPAFNFDITGYLESEDAVQFAHCGAAAPALAGSQPSLRTHMRTGTGVTLEFPFREGPVTLAKLLRPADGKLRLFVASGEAIPCGEGVRGSVATVRPDPSARAFLGVMIREAVEHHVALVYGDWRHELRLFCELTGVEYFS